MLIALLSTLIVLCAVLLISFLLERRKCLRMQQRLFRESRKLERTSHIAGAILKNVHAFILLIDNDFKVLKTNYYQKTGTRKSTFARSVNIFTTPNKEIRKVELNQEQHLKIFLMIGLVHYVESEKKTLNRTKDKTKRENY